MRVSNEERCSSSDEQEVLTARGRLAASKSRILSLLSTLKRDVGVLDSTSMTVVPSEISDAARSFARHATLDDMVNSIVASYYQVEAAHNEDPMLTEVKRLDALLANRENTAALTLKRIDAGRKTPDPPKVVTSGHTRQPTPTVSAKPQSIAAPQALMNWPEDLQTLVEIDKKLDAIRENPKNSARLRPLADIDADLLHLQTAPVMAAPVASQLFEVPPASQLFALEDSGLDEVSDLIASAESALAQVDFARTASN